MKAIRVAPIVILLLVLTAPFLVAADLPPRQTAAAIKTLETNSDPAVRFAITGKIMATIREQLLNLQGGELLLAALDTGLAMKIEHYTAGRDMIGRLQAASRREHMQWLSSSFAIYGAGLRSLNPGLARGKLRLRPANHHDDFDPQGIYLLPQTIAELPPVAGILTAGEGNPLSHVPLLARNLGIPNVTVAENLITELKDYKGQKIILAASLAGSYGVFVRSDTNVEDLPGFTGAGLNKTIPNVVGFEKILAAIPKVWASPFSRRAFAWRRVLKPDGGVDKELVADAETVLKADEIEQLINLAKDLPQRYPYILDADGNPVPADIEFGFINSKLQLFQI
jgi:hypothetical protein